MTLNLGSDYPSNWFDNVEAGAEETFYQMLMKDDVFPDI